jgi:uncharacterized protein (TIGR01244 family)
VNLAVRKLGDKVLVGGQIAPHEVAGLAGQGIRMIVNNRPDAEEPGQPLAHEIESAAQTAGIAYRFVPISRGIGPREVEAMQEALREAGDGKTLAFCRSGARSAFVSALAMRAEGVAPDQVTHLLADAGFDPRPIAHLL